jgi:phosphocarrier protein
MFAETAGRFNSEIRVVSGGQEVDGRSVLGLVLLEAVAGIEITIRAQGEDEIAAVNSLAGLVERDFED